MTRRLTVRHLGTAVFVGCCLFVVAQSIGIAHTANLKAHVGEAACQVCLVFGHAAAPPCVVPAPARWLEIIRGISTPQALASPARPTFSSHAARAPPAFH